MEIDCVGTSRAEVDISDEKNTLFYAKGFSHIINAAGYSSVEQAEKNREAAFQSNVIGPKNLARAAKIAGARLIHLSTDYVFDGKLCRFYREDDETNPLNCYGVTKREGELCILQILPEACILRVSTVFGGKGERHFVSQALHLMRQHSELKFVSDEIGCVTYVSDLVKAIPTMMDKSGIYHFANQGAVSKYAFINWIWEWAKRKDSSILCKKIEPVASAAYRRGIVRPLFTPLDTTKIEAFVKIRPWADALNEYITRSYPMLG